MRLALLLFAAVMVAQSQPPSPIPGKTAQKQQTETNPESNKTAAEKNPSNPNGFNGIPVITGGEQKQSSKDNESKASTDWWAIINTGLVTLFTGALAILARLQWKTLEAHKAAFEELAGHMRSALEETKKSANAAQRSADILVNTERAWLRVVNVQPSKIVLTTTLPDINEFVFDLENKGRTAARLTGPYRGKFHLLNGIEGLPEIPDYGPTAGLIPEHESPMNGRLLAPGELNGPISQKCISPAITEEIANGIQDHKLRLFFYASLKYFDCADQERELQFCYIFMPKAPVIGYQGRWVLAGPKEYNKHT